MRRREVRNALGHERRIVLHLAVRRLGLDVRVELERMATAATALKLHWRKASAAPSIGVKRSRMARRALQRHRPVRPFQAGLHVLRVVEDQRRRRAPICVA